MKTRHLVALLAVAAAATPFAAQADTSNATFAYTGGPSGSATLLVNGMVTLTATNRGWVSQVGANNGGGIDGNYLAGKCGSSDICGGDDLLRNNYFSFDLSRVGPITSAVLNLAQPDDAYGFAGLDGYIATAPSLTYALFDFLGAGSVAAATGTGVYADLGNGVSFGSVVVDASTIGTTVGIGFNAAGLAALNAAQGGSFAFGGSVNGLAGVPEPASWALMIGGFGIVGGAIRRRTVARPRFA